MNSEPRRWIAALRSSHDRLASLTRSLDSDQLKSPSYDDGWSIAQVLSHLGSQAEIFSIFLDAAVEGSDAPGSEVFPPIWDAWNARSPDEQAAESIEANEAFVRRAESLSDEQLGAMHASVFGMEVDGAGLFRMKLGEHAVHTWDVAVALDPTAEVSCDAVELLIDGVADLAGYVGKPQGRPVRLRVRTTRPGRDLLLSVADAVSIEAWSDQEADGVLDIPASPSLRRARAGEVRGRRQGSDRR